MFQKFHKAVIVIVILFGVVNLGACAPAAESAETTTINPESPSDEPITSVYSGVTSEGEFEVPSANLSPGKVVLQTTLQQYKKGEVVTISVANGLDQAIYAQDLKTACTIITLEKWNGSDWDALLDCGMERTAIVFAINPGMGRTITLDSGNLETGEYRVLFTYRFDSAREGEEPNFVSSDQFTIDS